MYRAECSHFLESVFAVVFKTKRPCVATILYNMMTDKLLRSFNVSKDLHCAHTLKLADFIGKRLANECGTFAKI